MRNHLWMAVGLGAGLVFGLVAAGTQSAPLLGAAEALRPLGRLFLNLLSMVVLPLVATALFTGVAGLGDVRRLGRLGLRTVGFFWGTTILGIAIGFLVAGVLLPLAGPTPPAAQALGEVPEGAERATTSGVRFLVELIPANPVRAAVQGNLLPLIVFVALFAVAAASLPEDKRRALTDLADAATQALIKVVGWVLLVAPVGIFALVAPAVAQAGWGLVRVMLVFLVAVAVGCAVLIGAVYVPALKLLARLGPSRFLRAALPSLGLGFSTTSSLATLPAMLDAAERDLRISRAVAGFALPLGASLNRAGSALYQAVALLFVARVFAVPLGPAGLLEAGAAVFLASLTVAAVPSASVLSLAPAFSATGLPLGGLALLIGLDRLPDMVRTMTNVTGHLSAAAVVAALEGERLA